jgi:hypothetical protein
LIRPAEAFNELDQEAAVRKSRHNVIAENATSTEATVGGNLKLGAGKRSPMATVAMKREDWRDLTAIAYPVLNSGPLAPTGTEGQNAGSDE